MRKKGARRKAFIPGFFTTSFRKSAKAFCRSLIKLGERASKNFLGGISGSFSMVSNFPLLLTNSKLNDVDREIHREYGTKMF
jgi:hypothetical protein